MVCCGEPMRALEANTTDAAQEKHVPVVEVNGNTVTVCVGSVLHPMLEEHHIAWIALETNQGMQRKELLHTGEPKLFLRWQREKRLLQRMNIAICTVCGRRNCKNTFGPAQSARKTERTARRGKA